MQKFWLMKTEPDVFSFDDLKKRPKKTEPWNGVRNYQARNFMKEMQEGDLVLFYHSSCEVPGVAGIARVSTKKAYPDSTQFDKKSEYFDPKATKENPRWFLVDVTFDRDLGKFVSLEELKKHKKLEGMRLLQKGNRLSILPVTPEEFQYIVKLGSGNSR